MCIDFEKTSIVGIDITGEFPKPWTDEVVRAAAELYVRFEKSKLAVDKIEAMLRDENMAFFSATPSRMMLFAEFMHKNGSLSTLPPSWEGFFHDNMRGRSGSSRPSPPAPTPSSQVRDIAATGPPARTGPWSWS